jgi:hypothetical protein
MRFSAREFAMPSAAVDLGKAEVVCPPFKMASMLTVIVDDWRSNASVSRLHL